MTFGKKTRPASFVPASRRRPVFAVEHKPTPAEEAALWTGEAARTGRVRDFAGR